MYNNDPTRVHGSINKSINRSNFRADSKNQHTMINKQQLALHQNEQKVTHPSNKRSKLNASDILSTITTENEKQYIINNHLYLNDNPDFVIILIQVCYFPSTMSYFNIERNILYLLRFMIDWNMLNIWLTVWLTFAISPRFCW